MAKIARKAQRIFGSTAGLAQIAQIGSLAAGTPIFSTDPTVIQALGNYLAGLFNIVIGDNSPAIEDINAVFYLYSYQLAYLFQAGISEYDSVTPYFMGSQVSSGYFTYTSIADNNVGNALTDLTKWKLNEGRIVTATTTYSVVDSDDYIRGDASLGAFSVTIPLHSATPAGRKIVIKKVDSSANGVTVQMTSPDQLDNGGAGGSLLLPTAYNSVTIINNGSTGWDII